MKKSKILLLFSLLACSILVLTACVAPPTYLITASVSDNSWGRVTGAVTEAMDEGTKITINAIESNVDEHPFICWVKDYNTFYSKEKQITLTYNQKTEGHYIAVFDEEANKMRFASLYGIQIDSSEFQGGEYAISYSSTESGTSNYMSLDTGSFESGETIFTDNSSIFYFGALGRNIEYKFQIELTITNADGQQITKTLNFTSKLSNALFTSDGICEIYEWQMDIDGSAPDQYLVVSLAFKKLSLDTYHTLPQ